MDGVEFHSSGSTGAAKRIFRTAASLDADAASLVESFPAIWGRGLAVVSSVLPHHMYGALWRVRCPRIAGVVCDEAVVSSVEELSALAAKYGRVMFVTTPSFLEKALLHPDFPSLRGAVAEIVTSGSLLKPGVSAAVFEATGVSPFEIYGSTEAGSVAWRRQKDSAAWTLCPGVSAAKAPDGGLLVDSPFAMERPFEMSDAVDFLGERVFVLGARLDRRVKVLEKYVSLPGVEAALETHPFVARARAEAFGDGARRIGALVVLSPEGVRALAAGTCAQTCAALRRALSGAPGMDAFPRRIRFVRELPANEQGKTTSAAALSVLGEWCQEPAVLSWRADASSLEARLVFTPDMKCFAGHFPGAPILPGVAQLYFLCRFARQAFRDFPLAAVYRRLKFRRVVVPGEETVLSVSRGRDGSFEFTLSCEGGICSSGTVVPGKEGK